MCARPLPYTLLAYLRCMLRVAIRIHSARYHTLPQKMSIGVGRGRGLLVALWPVSCLYVLPRIADRALRHTLRCATYSRSERSLADRAMDRAGPWADRRHDRRRYRPWYRQINKDNHRDRAWNLNTPGQLKNTTRRALARYSAKPRSRLRIFMTSAISKLTFSPRALAFKSHRIDSFKSCATPSPLA